MAELCGICQFSLSGEQSNAGDASQSLLCGHTFHSYCVDSYAQCKGKSLNELDCPICRRTGAQITALALASETMMVVDVDDILGAEAEQPAVEAEQPAVVEAEQPAVEAEQPVQPVPMPDLMQMNGEQPVVDALVFRFLLFL